MNKIIVFLLCLCSASFAIVIEGKVLDAQTQQPLPAVNITIRGATVGTTTNAQGLFSLYLSKSSDSTLFVFEHIGYEQRTISLAKLQKQPTVYLQPTVVQAPEVRVESTYESLQLSRDLPQSYSILEQKSFQARGYVDAGDLLKTEQSIQIDEKFSGQKTISIRGGNSDDVIVLYNGIKLNNSYDNSFDLSLLNLEDVQHVEVVKGSHTSLYGAEGFSGVVNVVPLTQPDYRVRFQQKFGTYNSGIWDAQLYYNVADKLDVSYTQKRGGSQRFYDESTKNTDFLNNDLQHHTAHLGYHFGANGEAGTADLLYLRTTSDYENNRNYESLQSLNELYGAAYKGRLGPVQHLHVVGALQQFKRNQFVWLEPDFVDRRSNNRSLQFNLNKHWFIGDLDVLAGYQYERSMLDYTDKRRVSDEIPVGIQAADASQYRQGAVMILKYHAPTSSEVLHTVDFDLSGRYDVAKNDMGSPTVRENEDPALGAAPPQAVTWNRPTFKFSTNLVAQLGDVMFEAFVNNSTNIKFPSLFQQLSTPLSLSPDADYIHPNLNPERTNSAELGLNIGREIPAAINSWLFNLSVFRNSYVNKFRMYYLNSIPMAFYDNVDTAKISGFEVSGTVYALQKAFSAQVGVSLYDVSAKSAFPFKSDQKLVCNLGYDAFGWSFQVHGFIESDQVGWVRDTNGTFTELELPGFANIDLHLGKSIPLGPMRGNINLSARNLLNDDTIVEGLALRDRRIYMTFGVQY